MKYLVLFIAFILGHRSALAQDWESRILQYNSIQVSTEEYSTLMDYDGDGLKDVVFGNKSLKELFLFKNQLNAPMQMELLTDTLFGVLALHGFDYNNDDFEDLLLGASTTQGYRLFLLINQGENQFEQHFVCDISSVGLSKIVTNDFDNDGDIDFIFDDFENSNIVYTVTNNGDNTFNLTWLEYEGQPSGLLGMADLDNDGDQDLYTFYFSFVTNMFHLAVEENIGNMEFDLHTISAVSSIFDGVIGDFDSDGFQDIILSYTNTNGELILNNGNFTFTETNFAATIAPFTRLSPAYDIDNDGDSDFLGTTDSELSLFTQNSTSLNSTLLSNTAPGRVAALYDFNQDGLDDLLFQVRDIWQGQGSTFEPKYSSYLSPTSVIDLGLIYSDGNIDFITAGIGGQIDIINHRFDERFDYATSTFIEGNNIDFSTPVREMIAYDRDQDGDSDLLCTISTGIYWLINNNGTFTQQTLASNVQAYELWIGDIDNDGNHDILYYDGQLRRREWNGNNYTSTSLPIEVVNYFAPIDIDGDLDLDILYFNYDINTISYELKCLVNNNNTFTTTFIMNISDNFPIEFNLFGECQFTPFDFDMDGDMDLVFASKEFSSSADNDYIAWLRNDGGLQFTPLIVSDAIGNFYSFDISDFDLDGDLDLVSSYGPQNGMRMFRNDGQMQFNPELIPNIVGVPVQIRAKDIDNDNDDDIVYCSTLNRRIGWLENLTNDCNRTYNSTSSIICEGDSVLFSEQYFFDSAILTDTLISASGCDSVNVLLLSVYNNPSLSISSINNIISATPGFEEYIWYYQEGLLPSETGNTIDAADYGIGNYFVQVISDNECVVSSVSLEIEIIVDINENSQNEIAIFPNPAEDNIIITCIHQEIQEILLFDNTGRTIIRDYPASPTATAQISHLNNGIYHLRCILTSGAVIHSKIVKK